MSPSEIGAYIDDSPFVEAGRVVLRNGRDEQSATVDAHRYGNPVFPSGDRRV